MYRSTRYMQINKCSFKKHSQLLEVLGVTNLNESPAHLN